MTVQQGKVRVAWWMFQDLKKQLIECLNSTGRSMRTGIFMQQLTPCEVHYFSSHPVPDNVPGLILENSRKT
jgi:hypothetical protein